MKILIKKDEYIFSQEGTHICNEHGIAIKANVDTECEIDEIHFERVRDLVITDRLYRGLDFNGDKIVIQEVVQEIIEEPTTQE